VRASASILGSEVGLAVSAIANRTGIPLTFEQFRFGFAKPHEDEAKGLYKTFAVRHPARRFPADSNLNPWGAKVDGRARRAAADHLRREGNTVPVHRDHRSINRNATRA